MWVQKISGPRFKTANIRQKILNLPSKQCGKNNFCMNRTARRTPAFYEKNSTRWTVRGPITDACPPADSCRSVCNQH